jgi:S-DNA-T family DNA segregation ATPase FtsK/SpoIIIE
MNRLMQYQADRIELVLSSHKVPARVVGGTVTPRLIRYQLNTPFGIRVKQVASLAEEIALSLSAPTCRVYRQEGQVHVEVPRIDGQAVSLLQLCRAHGEPGTGQGLRSSVPAHTAILGLDHEGRPLLLRLPSPDVSHVLIAGTTGSGKTALARSMIASLALFNGQRSLQLVLVDPKGRGLVPFAGLPHLLRPVVTRSDETLLVLQRLTAEMERRDAEARSEPRLVLVLDELADLVQVGGRDVESALTRLTQRGREAGVHLVACVQKPTAAVIGGLVKSNFPVRLVGSVPSPEDAKVATGLPGTGAERLLGQGDFLLVAKGQVARLQVAYIGAQEVLEMVARLREGEKPLLAGATATDDPQRVGGDLASPIRERFKARLGVLKSGMEVTGDA